jgi:hypothetical protein
MQEMAITKPKELKQPEHIPVSALIPSRHEWSVYQAMAENSAKTKFAQALGGPAGTLSIMLYARELGIPPMLAVMGGFHNIQGHIEMSARLINMRIRQEGHTLTLKKLDYSECIIYGKRTDTGEEMTVDYSMEDARRAELIKDRGNWDKHPKDMLWARAISRLGRRLFPDVIGNAYVEGEVREVFNITPEIESPDQAPLLADDQKISSPDENKLVKAEFWRKIKASLGGEIVEDDWPGIETKINDFLSICARHNEASTDEVIIEAIKDEETFDAFWQNLYSHMGKPEKSDPDQSSEASEQETKQNEDPPKTFRDEWIRLQTKGFADYVWKNLDRIKAVPDFHDEMREKWTKLYPHARFPLDPEPLKTTDDEPPFDPDSKPEKTEGELQAEAHLEAIHGEKNGPTLNCPKRNGRVFIKICEESCAVQGDCQPYQEHIYQEMG